MSVVHIINHDENIYNVERKEQLTQAKPPRYHSKFESHVRKECNVIKESHRTMGYAEVRLSSPDNYLKKDGGVRAKVPPKEHECLRLKIPPVPKRNSGNKKQKKDINFKAENIKKIIHQTPRRPKPRYADTKNGDFHDLEKSGLMPIYIYQPKFGKLPSYLIKRIRDAAIQQEMHEDDEARKQPLCRYITQEERAELLGGLKHNWEELQKTYQGLPVLTDTIPKILRKTNLEKDLKQLEKDILLVENHPYIYVYSDKK